MRDPTWSEGRPGSRDRRDGRPQSTTDRTRSTPIVAVMFRVGPKTVARWAIDGRLGCIRTFGGHRRFLEAEVAARLAAETAPVPRPTG
jgi:excisionase family DNA binding protein